MLAAGGRAGVGERGKKRASGVSRQLADRAVFADDTIPLHPRAVFQAILSAWHHHTHYFLLARCTGYPFSRGGQWRSGPSIARRLRNLFCAWSSHCNPSRFYSRAFSRS